MIYRIRILPIRNQNTDGHAVFSLHTAGIKKMFHVSLIRVQVIPVITVINFYGKTNYQNFIN
jgi:hypothetical protein